MAKGHGANVWREREALSGQIEALTFHLRLLYAATSDSLVELSGETRVVHSSPPEVRLFRGSGGGFASPTSMVRRVVIIDADTDRQVTGLQQLINAANRPTEGMHFTSLAMAKHKFTMSFHAFSWWEQIVDLSTALEAALAGKTSSDVLLRLKTRAAALLSTSDDPAQQIFADLGELYSLRSLLVHGGDITSRELERRVRRVSTVPPEVGFGVATAYAVDRLRDLVRRALLARICLALPETSPWPLDDDPQVDASLADDQTRSDWKRAWRGALLDVGAGRSADQAIVASDAIVASGVGQAHPPKHCQLMPKRGRAGFATRRADDWIALRHVVIDRGQGFNVVGFGHCRPHVGEIHGCPADLPIAATSADPMPSTTSASLQGGLCWWCEERPATTGEHKFKRTDLARIMGDSDKLLWGDTGTKTREIRGKSGMARDRYHVIKFANSLRDLQQQAVQAVRRCVRLVLDLRRSGTDCAASRI